LQSFESPGADALTRAREAWSCGEPERALALLRERGAEQGAAARALAADIVHVALAAEHTLAEFLRAVGTPVAPPARQRFLELRDGLDSLFDDRLASEAPTPRRHTRSFESPDAIHARLCGELPCDPNGARALYARADCVLVERGRDGHDLWWQGEPISVPTGQHPAPSLTLRLRAAITRHVRGSTLHAALRALARPLPSGLRQRLKQSLRPLLQRLG